MKPMARQNPRKIVYVCFACGRQERIPLSVVLDFDAADPGDPAVPPRFCCQHCPDTLMWPIFYRGLHGYTYTANPNTREATATPDKNQF
jgi:hypothetical protein